MLLLLHIKLHVASRRDLLAELEYHINTYGFYSVLSLDNKAMFLQ